MTRAPWSSLAALALVCAALLVACGSPIVGAECKSGFTACDGRCIDTTSDFQNCGACGNDCGLFLCEEGMCTTTLRPDAGPADGGLDGSADAGDASIDASAADSGRVDASLGDGGFDPEPGLGGCGVGQQDCGGQCVDPASNPLHCGACGMVCAGNEVCSGGVCAAACDPSLSLCNGLCLDFDGDANNCGSCGHVCASGICENGACADALPGYVVVIGHDMTSSNPAMRRLAGDAVFFGRGNPVRVLAYRGDALDASVMGVEAAIDAVSAQTGRVWVPTDAIESIVPLQLREADVLLVHAQRNARNTTLAKLGAQWGDALAEFVVTGGVIVLFEAPSARNDGTFRVLSPAKLFVAAGRDTVSSQQLKVVAVGTGVAMNLPDRYQSASNTTSFRGVTTPGIVMVEDKTGAPVVIQRVIVP